jgi:hypothetical protein
VRTLTITHRLEATAVSPIKAIAGGSMKAIHFISRRDGGIGLVGLTKLSAGTFRSECWTFGKADNPSDLVGGWIYLHPGGKDQPSTFGGKISEIWPCDRSDGTVGVSFVFEASPLGRGQSWRGPGHAMAYTSGIIDASFAHECD